MEESGFVKKKFILYQREEEKDCVKDTNINLEVETV
jgi:hypothetical protein